MQVHNLATKGKIHLCATAVLLLLALASPDVWAQKAPARKAFAPDSIELETGEILRGLIVRQTSMSVTIQLAYGEKTIPNREIRRIRNVDDRELWFTRILAPGSLPPWRIVANDLRNEDAIKQFQQIPATAVEEGVFKNVPYISFRANIFFEMNIYGDPDDPAGIEMGIYGPSRSSAKTHQIIRQFLGSYLTTIDEVRGLYSLNSKKDNEVTVGDMTMEVTLPNAPEGYGAWWLSFYNKKKLNEVRLTDAEYKKLTVPVKELLAEDGKVKIPTLAEVQAMAIPRSSGSLLNLNRRLIFENFYRDKEGNFHLIEEDQESPSANAGAKPTKPQS